MGAESRVAAIEETLERQGCADRPIAVLDLDAFDANLEDLARRAAGTPIRVASKSLRVRELLHRALAHPGFRGILAYTLPEALWLAEHGFEDIVLAYPSAERSALHRLAGDPRALEAITLMVDETAQFDLIQEVADETGELGSAPDGRRIRVAIELDVSYEPVPGVRFGAYRSPVRTPGQAVALAQEIAARPSLRLVGLMAYEGHIAGVTDAAATPYGAAVRAMKTLSRPEIAERRAEVVSAVREVAELEFVNGGGTGSIESTGAEAAVTEIAAGSGMIGPGLFDQYQDFQPHPALHLGFSVVRRPAPSVATLLGGGWIASGVPGQDRLPTIAHPSGLAYAPQEAAGEVQTPVIGAAAENLRVGDTVWLRHAKAGEPAEHVLSYLLVAGSGQGTDQIEVVGSAPTYRGEGTLFL
ncbi:MAG: alanine racemase [Brachybacterium sp.]|uniref:alanine racemase n=1 Tax=Brachybacterium sp. AOP35-5H-19 TaxID=3457685 RepID=UPI003FB70537